MDGIILIAKEKEYPSHDVVAIVKKISGTIITTRRFKNKSPKGFKHSVFSLNIIPTIIPIIIEDKSMMEDL